MGPGVPRDVGAAVPAAGPAISRRLAYISFAALFVMNLLDYMDRNILSAVLPFVRESLEIGPAAAGRLPTYFLITFSLFGLIIGYAGDRMRRTYLLAFGVGLWSLATVGSGLARSYGQLVVARSLLGIGEATYGVIAPTLLLDLFPRRQRGRVMSAFYLAMPIGSALGIALGGVIAKHYGWQVAFYLVGAPGLLAAFAALWLPEPARGSSEGVGVDEARLEALEKKGATWADYRDLLVNSSYTYTVFGMTAYTFAIGGLTFWFPSYLYSVRAIPEDRAAVSLGVVTLLAAIVGMTAGGWLADRLTGAYPRALMVVPGVAMLAALPFIVLTLMAPSQPLMFGALFLAEALLFMNIGPCNAVIGNVVPPYLRASAYATAIFCLHFLGDIWSPWLIGAAADYAGRADTMATPLGSVLARLGALPVQVAGQDRPENLTAGLLVVLPAVALSGVVLLAGSRHLPRETALMLARLRATAARVEPARTEPGDT